MAASLSISHAVITIDGDFSDWMMLSENDYVQNTIDENAQFTNLRNMRFTKDSECIYFYIEYTNGRMVKYLDIYMSTDSDETTGYNSPHWVNSGADFLFESDLTDTTGTVFVFASQDQNEFEAGSVYCVVSGGRCVAGLRADFTDRRRTTDRGN